MKRPADEAYFDSVYGDGSDPWGFQTRWYEQRKRALTLAALPHARYARALEAGCANGELTAALAPRCDQLLACDFHHLAVALARRRTAAFSQVRIERRQLPQQWPPGSYELIVISELAYYLSEVDLRELLRRTKASLASAGVLLACHWRHPIAAAQRSGDAVHEAFAQLQLPRLLRHEEADFVMEVWSPDPRSVARAEGLA